VLLLGYLLPLAVAVALMLTHGLLGLGIALLLVEGTVVTGIRLATRPRPDAPVRTPGQPVLGLPGDRAAGTGARSAVLLAVGLTAVVLVIGLVVALLARGG